MLMFSVFVIILIAFIQYMYKIELEMQKIKTCLIVKEIIPNTIFENSKEK